VLTKFATGSNTNFPVYKFFLFLEEPLANHKSAIKRHTQSLKRAARNRALNSRIKSVVKNVRAAVQANNSEQAKEALTVAKSVIDSACSKGVAHWKNAARKVSRLSKAVNGIVA
jgi:small subunit ribosomal protein S20